MATRTESDLAGVIFLATILSVVLQKVKVGVRLPVQVMLMIAGFVYQVVTEKLQMNDLEEDDLRSLNEAWLLLILIPSSTFPYTFSLEWFTVRRQSVQLFLLSTLAPAASAAAMAATIAYVLRYEAIFDWSELVLLGIMLSVIEHASVLYQLKSVHASEKLETMVQGEALTNTGTMVVAFLLSIEHAQSGIATNSELAKRCARMAFGGLALGLGAAAIVNFWIRKTKDKHPHVVFLAVFLVYYVAEETDLDVGGAIAVVSFCLYLCAYGKLSISPQTEAALDSFWGLLKDNIEAVVLFFGGVFFSSDLLNMDLLDGKDFLLIFALFGLLHVIRLVVVVLLFPVLRCFGYGCNWREAVVLAVGTTKGSIVTCLGIAAHNNASLSPKLRAIALIWSVGVSGLSLLFDTVIANFTLRKLGLESLSNAQEDMLVSVTTSILSSVGEKVVSMKKDFAYKYVNWQQVHKSTGSSALLMDVLRSTRNGKVVIKEFEGLSPEELFLKFTEHVAVTDQQIEVETRYRFFTTLKGLYWKRFHTGKLSEANIEILLNAANEGLDHTQEVMFDWYLCEGAVFPQRLMYWLIRLGQVPLVGRWFTSALHRHVINAYDVAWNFLHAHLDAEGLLDQLEIDVDKSLFVRVMHESHAQIELCRSFVRTKIADMFPELNEYVQTKRACSALLHTQRDLVEQAYQHGTLIQREHSELIDLIDSQINSLRLKTNPDVHNADECIRRCEVFSRMYEPDIRDVISMSREVFFKAKDFLFSSGETVPGLFLITKGRVEEFDNDFFSGDRGVGSILGLHYIVKPTQVSLTSARALTSVAALMLPMSVSQVFERNIQYLAPLWTVAAGQVLNLYIYDFGPLWELEAEQQAVVLSESKLEFYDREDAVEAKTGGLLFRGGFSGVATGLGFVKPSEVPLVALQNTVFFHFSPKISDVIMANITNLQYILATLTAKDASGQCKLYSGDEEEKEKQGSAPRIKVSLSSRFNSIARGSVHIFPNSGQRLSPRREMLRSAASSMALLSEPVSETLGEEGQGFLQSQESRASLDKNIPALFSENLVTIPSENVGISTDEDSRVKPRLSLKIPNFRG